MRWELIHASRDWDVRNHPEPRLDGISWYCDEELWLFSGQRSVDFETELRDMWRYDVPARVWSKMPFDSDTGQAKWDVPVGRSYAATWVKDSELFMYGG